MSKETGKPITEKSSAGLFTAHLGQVNAALPPEKRGDPQAVFEGLAARLVASHERTKKIQRGLKLGWSLEDLFHSTAAELDAKTKTKPPGRHPGVTIQGLRAIRKKLKLTQEALADKCGVPLITIQRLEANRRVSKHSSDAVLSTLAQLDLLPVKTRQK